MKFPYYCGAEFVRKPTGADKIHGCPDSAHVKRGQADGFSVILRRGFYVHGNIIHQLSAAQ